MNNETKKPGIPWIYVGAAALVVVGLTGIVGRELIQDVFAPTPAESALTDLLSVLFVNLMVGVSVALFIREFRWGALRIALTVALALLIGFIITLLVSETPIESFRIFLTAPLSKMGRYGYWIQDSTSLILVGLAVALVFEAKQFSLGAEGQIYLAAVVSGIISLFVPMPPLVHALVAILPAISIAYLWGWIPGLLKAYINADEIVSTLMLNTVAIAVYNLLLTYRIKPPDAGGTFSDIFPASGVLPHIVSGTRINFMVLLLPLIVFATWYLMYRTPLGYEIRTIGANWKFASYGGVDTQRIVAQTFALSGVLAGLAGVHLSMGIHQRLWPNISVGLGFDGIVVALLARNHPLAVPFTALLYGYLRAGAFVMGNTTDVAREMVQVIQAIVILLITAEQLVSLVQKIVKTRRRKGAENVI